LIPHAAAERDCTISHPANIDPRAERSGDAVMPITPFGWRAAELFSICRYLDEAGGRLIVTLMEPYDITSIVYAARLGEVVTGSVEDGEVIRKLGGGQA
jgi:hypothetical protein